MTRSNGSMRSEDDDGSLNYSRDQKNKEKELNIITNKSEKSKTN